MATRVSNGEAIRAIREALGITQPGLAQRVGLTQGALSNIERGSRNASPHVLRAIANELGVGVGAITTNVIEPDGIPA
jgi:transcriptional regulator with XRE-family HTH domain